MADNENRVDPITGGQIKESKPVSAAAIGASGPVKSAPQKAASSSVSNPTPAPSQAPTPPTPPRPPVSGPPAGGPPRQPMPGRPVGKPEHKNGGFALILVLGGILFLGITLFIITLQNLGGENSPISNAFGISGIDLYQTFYSITNIVFGMAIVLSFITFILGIIFFFMGKSAGRQTRGSRKTMIVSAILIIAFLGSYLFALSILRPGLEAAQVEDKREIGIVADQIKGSAPFPVKFEFSEQEELTTSYTWDFGDGSDVKRGHNIKHIFTKTGDFDVELTVRSDLEENTFTKRIIVENILANVVIGPSVTEGEAPLEVFFDGSRSRDVDGGDIEKFEWDFGDIGSDERTAEGERVRHTFFAPGVYTVVLSVTDSSGYQSENQVEITVESPDKKPVASIVTDPVQTTGRPPFKVDFNGSGSYDPQNGRIIEYEWDFGDGSQPERTRRASHIFVEPGIYEVELTVTNDGGIKNTETIEITVQNEEVAPTAKIKAESKLKGEAPYRFEVTGRDSKDADGEIVLFEWDFGDKTEIKFGQDTSHQFTRPGTYTVRLTVTDDTDREGIDEVVVVVTEATDKKPKADVISDPSSGVVPLTVQFDATGSSDADGQIIAYNWDFGDGTPEIQTAGKVSHRFNNVGTYTVTLRVTDNDGLSDEAQTSIAVNRVLPVANIDTSAKTGKVPFDIQFSAADSTGFLTEFRWDFGDGVVRFGSETNHTYYEPGLYDVTLTVTDNAGVTDTKSIKIVVNE